MRSVKYGLYGFVLAALVAVPAVVIGFGPSSMSVRLVVDGRTSTVHTTATHVADLLGDRGYRTTRHDIVAPSPTSKVADGMQVVLRRGRLLHLDVDGRRTDVWTTAPTVAVALQQLGYTQADFVSVSRSRRLPLSSTAIAIRSMRTVTVIHDGRTDRVSTTQPTVSALLTSMRVAMNATDRSNVPMSAPVTDGQQIILQRVTSRTISKKIALKYTVQKRSDKTMTLGDTQVVTDGREGLAKVFYSIVYVDGKLAGRSKLRTDVVTAPRTKVVAVGTKKPTPKQQSDAPVANTPVTTTGNSPAAAKKIAKEILAKRGMSDQFDCVDYIFSRESGWRVHAENSGSGAYGIPQALPGSKMASYGDDWQDNAATQIKWGLNYMISRYDSPCGARSYWESHGWY